MESSVHPVFWIEKLSQPLNEKLPFIESLGLPVFIKGRECDSLMDLADRGFTHVFRVAGDDLEAVDHFGEWIEEWRRYPDRLIALSKKSSDTRGFGFLKRLEASLLGENSYKNMVSPYTVYPLSAMVGWRQRSDYPLVEAPLLIHLLWKGVEGQAIEIFAADPMPKVKSLSHKFWYYIYDFLILGLSNIQNNNAPKRAAFACGLGAFIACSPFYGLQTLAIFFSCYLLRLSFPIAFLGSQVSLPPIYSVVVPLELIVGWWVLGVPIRWEGNWLSMAQEHFSAWFVGSLIIGFLLSVIIGLSWYRFQMSFIRAMQKHRQS
ncbi:MAG: DUF2062 domain-containing protein [Bdellovibrionales bacterium]|nr:DUF2062 domain-containing protein [Bdellovibrionales bacterium]